jgi:hypothetical protein
MANETIKFHHPLVCPGINVEQRLLIFELCQDLWRDQKFTPALNVKIFTKPKPLL